MTDVLPRLDGAFDDSDAKTLNRRQLIRAGAWAAPVIVLATAAPAAAQSITDPGPYAGATWEFSAASLAFKGEWYAATGFTTKLALANTTAAVATAAGTISAITVDAVYPLTQFSGTPANPTAVAGTGWSFLSKSVGTSTVTYHFTYAATVAKGTSSNTLSYDIATTPSFTTDTAGRVTFLANASGPQPVSTSAHTAVDNAFWHFNAGTTGGMSNQGSYLQAQLQISTDYQSVAAQTAVTFRSEVRLPAAIFKDEAPTVTSVGNGWRYAGRRMSGPDLVFDFDFSVNGDPSKPRPLQHQPTVPNAVSDTQNLGFRANYKSGTVSPKYTVTANAMPIAPLQNGSTITTSKTFG